MMRNYGFGPLQMDIAEISPVSRVGRVLGTTKGVLRVSGLSGFASVGDLVRIEAAGGSMLGEVVDLAKSELHVFADGTLDGVGLGTNVVWIGAPFIRPDISWVGRMIDGYANPIDGRPLMRGMVRCHTRTSPPAAAGRNRLGQMLETGVPVLNTFLPLVRGQRVGLFAGSGVGKSSLLAMLAKRVASDFIVIGLVGERGREVREFVEDTLGPEGLARSVIVAATSDQSPIARRRAAWTAMTVAEYLRDQGGQVLLLMDSLTRFCEAHREVVTTTGEAASIDGFPPSTAHALMELCERAGPGPSGKGDITAIMSVLVAGSDMEGPIADMARGVLDGHILLDRAIAERGRFPAIDVLGSVSRSFLDAMGAEARKAVRLAKQSMASYAEAELMVQTGLYQPGSDPVVDVAITRRPQLESFLSCELDDKPTLMAHDQARLAALIHATDPADPENDATKAENAAALPDSG